MRLCHIISCRRRRGLLRLLFNVGAIFILDHSQAGNYLGVIKVSTDGSVIKRVQEEMRCGRGEGNVCRVGD